MSSASQHGVLVVEDEEELRTLLSLLLEIEKYVVFQAEDGVKGLELLQRQAGQIALVITDLGLPNMGGLSLIGKVRSISPTVKVIATSGLGGVNVREMVLQAGANEFIPKPFSAQDVLQKVKDLMS